MENYENVIMEKTLTVRLISTITFFIFCFIGGLLQVGDFSIVAVIDRLFTALVQVIFFYAACSFACYIYAYEKKERMYGDI